MRLNGPGWRVITASTLAVAMLAPVALAQEAPPPEDIIGRPLNGLSSKAFRRNALTTNREALRILLDNALNEDLFQVEGGYIGRQLHDPKARAVMEELVACALDRSTKLRYASGNGRVRDTWPGELGLCQSWHQGRPDEACQEIVTACVMARVNARGKAIPLSIRSTQSSLSKEVLTDTRFRESPPGQDPSEGWPIPSFARSCASGQDCNWAPAYVGRCTEDGDVSIAIEGPACESTKLRVCAGIHGCLGPGSGDLLPPGFPPSRYAYSKHLEDKAHACSRSPLRFRCPIRVPFGGYYSVMTSPRREGGVPPIVVKVSGSGAYPAPEGEVFTHPEGAFYGNLFEPKRLRRSCEVNRDGTKLICKAVGHRGEPDCETGVDDDGCSREGEPLASENIFACYSFATDDEDDAAGAAALNHRLCNSPDPDASCFPHQPRRCRYKDPSIDRPSAGCVLGENGVVISCKSLIDGGKTFTRVITTHLNDACDLIDDAGLRTRMCNRPPPPPPRLPWRRIVLLSMALVVLAASVTILLARRRRRTG